MNLQTQKKLSAVIVGTSVVFCLEALILILNLNQSFIFFKLAFWIWVYLAVVMAFWYDLHFKNPGAFLRAKAAHEHTSHWLKRNLKIFLAAFWDRIEHFRRWTYFKHWQNYLLLPALTFWATVIMFYLNIGPWNWKIQQIFVLLSGLSLTVNYWFLKEVFRRRREMVDSDVFIALSVVKIYTAGLLYAAALGLMWRNDLSPTLYAALILGLTFLLVYQALFQHRLINLKNLGLTLVISLLMAIAAYLVYIHWGYNFYTAAIFLTAVYNLLWGIFHYHLDRTLTLRAFAEIAVISILIGIMVLSVTNFKAKII